MSTVLDRPETDATTTAPGDDAAVTPPTGPASVAAWLALLALAVGVVLAPPGDSFAGGDFGRVLSGTVELRQGTDWTGVGLGERIPHGATVRTLDAIAEIEVRGGRLSLARWSQVTVERVELELARGELLLEADRTYAVRYGALDGRGRGSWRVSAHGAVRYAVYAGGVAVRQPGGEDEAVVGSLREATFSEGTSGGVRPLTYLPSDPWDARLLSEAIRIDRLLAATERGLRARYGTALQPPAFYGDFSRFEALLDELALLAAVAEDGAYGPPADTLVAMIVAQLLVGATGLEPGETATRIDRMRAAGATWGLIVVDHGLDADHLDRTIERAVRQRGEAGAEGTAAPVLGPPAPPGPAPTTPPSPPPGTPGPTPPPPTPPDDDGDEEPPDDDEPGALDPVTEPVTDAVTDTVDDLGALLEEVLPGASEVTDTANEVVEDVVDLLP